MKKIRFLGILGRLLTDTLELPGVVPYPDEGKLATDHLRPSTFLTFAKANWFGETLGESKGLTLAAPGLWHLGKVGEVCTIIDFRCRAVAAEGLRCAVLDNDNSFCKNQRKRGFETTQTLNKM